MNFKINFPDLENASKFADTLKNKNIRGVKIQQERKQAEDGSLAMAEFMPLIMLAVKSGLATAVVTQVFGLLKNGFFSKNKEIASNEKIELAKSDIEKNKVEFNIECGEKKLNFKITKGSEEEMKSIIQTIQSIENDC